MSIGFIGNRRIELFYKPENFYDTEKISGLMNAINDARLDF